MLARTRSVSAWFAALVAVVSVGTLGSPATSFGATHATATVSSTPAAQTPHLVTTGTTEQIRQLVPCGSMMYAVGTFTKIGRNSTTYTRGGAFSFSATAPYKVSSWDPEVNGTVDTIAFNGADCSNAYLGGKFTSVGATSVKNLAEVSTSTSAAVPAFRSTAAGEVDTIVGWNGHLLTGGIFTSVNGTATDPYFASLNPTTGKNDGYLALGISGNYVYTDQDGERSASNVTRVYNQQLSPDGTRDLVEGDFTTIGGQPRRQIAMLDLGANGATIDAWNAPEFNANCNYADPFYARAAAWSPDGSTVYVASTGYKPASGAGFDTGGSRAGLCDSASAFASTSGSVSHRWINYTGCDSMYSTAADASTAYFGGHGRWADNTNGCDVGGRGSVVAQGMVGISPSSGLATFTPNIARGLGADDMLVTAAGLWIASDNYQGSQTCAGVNGHAGLCLLPS
jgi:hypothetical protein